MNATIPVDFLSSTAAAASHKVLYALFQLLPDYQASAITAGYAQLCNVTGRSRQTIRAWLQHMRDLGWITVDRPVSRGQLVITARNPHVEAQQQAIAAVQRRLHSARFFGETLMREWLNLLVDTTDFEDDATPGFLINPYTSEELQIDRLYWKAAVGFVFNGAQHYGPTALYPDPDAVRRQQARDLIKLAICIQRDILLVPVLSHDLSLEGMLRLIPDRLPLRCLDGQELLIAYLEAQSSTYRQRSPLPPPIKQRNLECTAQGQPNSTAASAPPRGTTK